MIANLFAFRSTSPEIMKQQKDPIGKENDLWIGKLADASKLVIAAWGNHGLFLNRCQKIEESLPPMKCLGLTLLKQPKHPLYLKKNSVPQDYPITERS